MKDIFEALENVCKVLRRAVQTPDAEFGLSQLYKAIGRLKVVEDDVPKDLPKTGPVASVESESEGVESESEESVDFDSKDEQF